MSQMRMPLRAEGKRLFDAAGSQVIATPDGLSPNWRVDEAAAERIAGCVNACAGLKDPGGAVETLKMLVRDLYACGAEGGRLDSLWELVENAAHLIDWPTDRCWGCGVGGEDGGWWDASTMCCENCGRVAKPPMPVAD